MNAVHSGFMLEARGLCRAFGAKAAVKDISFSVRNGEIFGLLGPNGAGKTTTIRMLTGQIDPTSGVAQVAGCDVVKERALLKQRIGVVFEDQNLYERLSARLNLEFSCWLYGLPKQRVDEVLTLVGLRERAKDRVSTFSNGMRQRLMIARALLHRPPVLLLDEPGRGLDPISARAIRQTIKQLSQEGVTILLTTHLMDEADQLCQHVAFIVDGHIVANDTPRNLKLSHGQPQLVVTLQSWSKEIFEDIILNVDNVHDQQELCQLMTQGKIRALFSISVGLLAGSIFQTTSAAGAFTGIVSFIYIIPVFFVGAFSSIFGNNPFSTIIKVLPTYYIADGVANALSGQASWSGTLLDVGIILACIMLIFLTAVSLLRRQAAITATI